MESIYENGGMIGATLDIASTDLYGTPYNNTITSSSGGTPEFRWTLNNTTAESGGHSTTVSGTITYGDSLIPNSDYTNSADFSSGFLVPANSTLINIGTFTKRSISFWFNADTIDTNFRAIFEEGGGVNWFVIYVYDGDIYVNIGESSVTGGHAAAAVSASTSYHCLVTVDLSLASNNLKIYLNGTLTAQASSSVGTSLNSHSGDVRIGRGAARNHLGTSITYSNFDGRLQDFCYWYEDALTSTDAADIYNAGAFIKNRKNSGIWNLKAAFDAIEPYFTTEINAIFDSMDDATIPLAGLNFKAGDNLFVCIYNENSDGAITMNSSGWTLIDSTVVASTGGGGVYHKVSDGTESSVVITPSAFVTTGAIVVAVDALYTYQSVQDNFLTSTSPNPPALGGFSTGDISLVFGAYGDDVVTMGVPSGYTLLARGTSGSTGSGMSCAVGWRTGVSGTVDPGVFSGGDDENYAAHIRLSI